MILLSAAVIVKIIATLGIAQKMLPLLIVCGVPLMTLAELLIGASIACNKVGTATPFCELRLSFEIPAVSVYSVYSSGHTEMPALN